MEYKKIKDITDINPENITNDMKFEYINYLDTSNITKGKINDIIKIDYKDAPSRAKRIVKVNDIIYSSVRPNLCHYGILRNVFDNMIVSTGFIVLRCKENVLPEYLYAYITLPEITKKMHLIAITSTSAYPSIKPDDLANLEIPLPSLKKQEQISKILSTIDKKIELNNQVNQNLFNLLKLEFRSKYYNIEGDRILLSNLVKNTISGDWGKEKSQGNNKTKVYCVRGADIPDMEYGNKGNAPVRYILEKNYKNKKLDPDNIIVEISGGSPTQSTGRTAYITQNILDMYDSPLLCTNFCKAIEVKDKKFAPYVYMIFKLKYEDGIFFNWENGTTGIKNFALTDMLNNTEVVLPKIDQIEEYYNLFYTAMNKISINSKQNQMLEKLRDILLPKLMNDEINLNNIDE